MYESPQGDAIAEPPARANRIGKVETVYPHVEASDASNYEVDVTITDTGDPTAGATAEGDGATGGGGGGPAPSNFTYPRVPVKISQPGVVRGIKEGTLVVISYFNGHSEDPYVDGVIYSGDERAPLCEPGDWRNRIDTAVVETIEDENGDRLIRIGRQPDDRGDLDMGLYMNLDKGGFEIFDAEGNGLCCDGQGNVVLSQASAGGTPSQPGQPGAPSQPNDGEAATTDSTGGDPDAGANTGTPTPGDTSDSPDDTADDTEPALPDDDPISGTPLEDAVAVARNAGNTVVDLADAGIQAGADITSEVADALGDATSVLIPDGNYQFNPGGISGEYENAEIIGRPTASDAIAADGGTGGLTAPVLEQPTGTTGTAEITITGGGEGSFHVRNLEIKGARDAGSIFDIAVTDRGSSAVFADVHLPDGDTGVGTPAPAITVRGTHRGTCYIRNCHIEGFRDGGIDASAPGADGIGRTVIQGGLVRDCNVANVLLSGPGSRVRDLTCVQTGASPTADPARGVWLTDHAEADCDNVDVVYEDTGTSAAEPIKVGGTRADPTTSTGDHFGKIRNSRIKNDHTEPIIDATGGEWDGPNNDFTGAGNLEVTGVALSNTGRGPAADAPSAFPRVSWY